MHERADASPGEGDSGEPRDSPLRCIPGSPGCSGGKGRADVIGVERRLTQPRWLKYLVPFVSVAFAFVIMAVVLLATGHDPIRTYRRLFDAAFHGSAAWTDTFTLATPLICTGLAAAVAFRMQLFNIRADGQLDLGAIGA